MKNKFIAGACLLIAALFLTSCSGFNSGIRPDSMADVPKAYSLYENEVSGFPQRWWRQFDSPTLDSLIEEALSGSFSLKEAWARLKQVRELAVQSGAGLYPDLNATSGASWTRQNADSVSMERESKDFSLGLAGSYELDLWGRIRSGRQADLLEVSASREEISTAAMTLAAGVTSRWLDIISQTMQLGVLEKQLQTNTTYLELIELRFQNSMATALDVFQQKQIVEKIKSQIPSVAAQKQLLAHELAVLIGKPPQYELNIENNFLPDLIPIPAAGIPADLLSKRPDIRAAGFRLQAADWQVAEARANRLPTISLSAQALYSADQLDLIFDNWLLNLAGNLVGPLIDGGQRSSEVRRQQAVVDEKLAAYRQTVYTAIKEVEDALVTDCRKQQRITALESQIDAARKALEEARQRYFKGVNDYLPVLTQLLAVQGLELDLIQEKTQLLTNRVGLYRALGGTWTDALKDERPFGA
ncbi:MAG: efflux transporter outer membrane subunit [Desulfobacterales bacterium]|nr:efflux transporter outer membrane subunit [Desulfobacterales bacterium]MDD4073034.1 efflux transporter outer membrane subunit [Desulfobacterales bacterium]MDD4392817.1 efflux transporter outer membrane subunit [Desulfobacterales bacterium]